MFSALISGYRFLYLQLAALVGYGWAIVALSFVCSFLMLPLMRAVAGVVHREKEYEDVIDPQVAAIKAKFASDMDRHFHIQRLYQRYGYSPLAPIKKILPLFVQIPFLLLTYYMLKGTAQLSGVSFLFLVDLGQPDALLPHAINLLPLVMTGVNILTVFATPGFSHKDWTQAICISLFFLVLLYSAPSALLLYWTLNNTITFIRTLCEKHCAGARLLSCRIAVLPGMLSRLLNPLSFVSWLNARSRSFWAYAAYVLVLLSVYMYVLANFLSGGWRNWYAAFYLQNIVLAVAVYCTYRTLRDDSNCGRAVKWISRGNVWIAGCVLLINVALDATIPFTGKYMHIATEVVPLTLVFEVFLALWSLPLLMLLRTKPLFSALRSGFGGNAFLLLLPVALGVHYAFSSANFKLPAQSVVLLCGYLLLPCVLIAGATVALFYRFLPCERVARISICVVIGVWLLPMVSVENGPIFGYGFNLPVRILVLTAVPLLCLRIKSRVTETIFVSLLTVSLLVTALFHCNGSGEISGEKSSTAMASPFDSQSCVRTNNVYLLIYDSYPHQIVLDALGLDNHSLPQFLSDHGFTNYSAYSEGCDTIGSMSAFFGIGGVHASPRARMAGSNPFCEFLRKSGYRTNYMLCGYSMPGRGELLPGDFYFPRPTEVTRPEMVLFPWIVRGCLTQLPNVFNHFTDEERIQVKRRLISEMGGRRSFLYSHCPWPEHAPVSIANRADEDEVQEGFRQRMEKADKEIREDVLQIAKQDPEALVIVASDHGGVLIPPEVPGRYDARHLIDRCGCLLAIRWPKGYKPTLNLYCLQNVLVEVMIFLTGDASLSRLERKGITQAVTHPVKAPAGAVEKGQIMVGSEAGKSLFTAARETFLTKKR